MRPAADADPRTERQALDGIAETVDAGFRLLWLGNAGSQAGRTALACR